MGQSENIPNKVYWNTVYKSFFSFILSLFPLWQPEQGSLLEGPELFPISLVFKRWHPSVSWQWFSYWKSSGRLRGECICTSFLSNQWASLQAQLVWLIDCKDSQNEQLNHLTAWFPHQVLTHPKLHMLQYLQSCHCCTTLTGNSLLTEVLGEPIKIWNQISLACFTF